jgi:transposase-like protein
LTRLAADVAGAPTPRAALRNLNELRREIDAFERRQVAQALAEGETFAAIARELGISRQAVHRRFRNLASGDLPLPTAPDVRRILQYAREEATELGADELRGEHIVIAVLRAPELHAAVLLRSSGATLTRARSQVEAASPRQSLFRRELDTSELRSLLATLARRSRAHGGHRIEVEDLLLGTLDDPAGGASRTLRAIGVDPKTIQSGLHAMLESRPAQA